MSSVGATVLFSIEMICALSNIQHKILATPQTTDSRFAFQEGKGQPAYVVDSEAILAHYNFAGGRCAEVIHGEHIAVAASRPR
jgi:hypothetical protein